jgi:DNA-binding IclR family transcriptional regulator
MDDARVRHSFAFFPSFARDYLKPGINGVAIVKVKSNFLQYKNTPDMPVSRKYPPAGTQSIVRTILVLKTLALRKEIGWRLTDLAAHCNLDNATTYRIVACLTTERLAQQRPSDRRYVPGPLLFELALAVPAYNNFASALRPELLRLARRLDCIVFLYLRSGNESICIERVGSAPVQPLTVVGTRRPMAGSMAGIAMLLPLPRKEQQALIAEVRNHPPMAERAPSYRNILQRSRRHGFGVNRGDVVPGLAGLAVPITDAGGWPFAAIGIMGPTTTFAASRLNRMGESLREEARRIGHEHARLIKYLQFPGDGKNSNKLKQ